MYSQVGAGSTRVIDFNICNLGFPKKGLNTKTVICFLGFQEMNLCRERISLRSHEGEFQLSLGSVGHRWKWMRFLKGVFFGWVLGRP